MIDTRRRASSDRPAVPVPVPYAVVPGLYTVEYPAAAACAGPRSPYRMPSSLHSTPTVPSSASIASLHPPHTDTFMTHRTTEVIIHAAKSTSLASGFGFIPASSPQPKTAHCFVDRGRGLYRSPERRAWPGQDRTGQDSRVPVQYSTVHAWARLGASDVLIACCSSRIPVHRPHVLPAAPIGCVDVRHLLFSLCDYRLLQTTIVNGKPSTQNSSTTCCHKDRPWTRSSVRFMPLSSPTDRCRVCTFLLRE